MDRRPEFLEHRVVLADGLRMYCRDYPAARPGDRPTVLCLPGLTRNCRDFEGLASALAGRHRVLTPDLRGRGGSDRDPEWRHYQPLNYVADVAHLLRVLGAGRVVVIGTSLGGLIAMLMAALQPEALAGVVLNDIGPELEPTGISRIGTYVGQLPPLRTWNEAAAQARRVHEGVLPDLGEAGWMAFARRVYREESPGLIVPDMDPMIGVAMRETAGQAADLWVLYRALNEVPTLAIRGELSDLLSADTLRRMKETKPDLQTLVVPRRGHAPTLDEPECRRAIAEFIEPIR
jgi:pimeloyl-ACP methyl ester carboxylesterase